MRRSLGVHYYCVAQTASVLFCLHRQSVSCDDAPLTVEDYFHSYFGELNRLVGDKLTRLASGDETELHSTDISAMALDSSDVAFINELLDSFNLDITVSCGMCSCLPG